MDRILLIEDDIEICEMVEGFLGSEGFEVTVTHDGESGYLKFTENAPALVLLDIMMPKLDGFNVIQKIRSSSTVPIIIISARDTEFDKISGLGMGADDYVTKPFSMTELLARMKSTLRRTIQYARLDSKKEIQELKAGDIIMNLAEIRVTKNKELIELTATEFEILKLLFLNPKKVYTKAQIYNHVWKDAYFGDENAVNVHISRLRNKIEDNSKDPKYIKTVWGIGYKLGINMIELWIFRLLVITTVILVITILLLIKSKVSYKRNLTAIAEDLCRILDNDTDEKIMLFTDDIVLIKLSTQINRILEERQKNRANYLRAQFSTKRMLSNISHDIRTPMTVIQGYIEILMMNDQNDTVTLTKVDGKVKQVTKLIEEFFTVSKLESGDYPITVTRVHCNEVCKNSVIGFYDILTENKIEVDIDIPEQDIFAYADSASVERILYNLISNAIRYGFEGKYLKLKLHQDDNSIYIDVLDKGKGIDPQSSKHVFDRLYIVDDSRNKDIRGNGLGLTIAKGLAEKMGGTVSLRSEPHTKTVFTLKLKKYDF